MLILNIILQLYSNSIKCSELQENLLGISMGNLPTFSNNNLSSDMLSESSCNEHDDVLSNSSSFHNNANGILFLPRFRMPNNPTIMARVLRKYIVNTSSIVVFITREIYFSNLTSQSVQQNTNTEELGVNNQIRARVESGDISPLILSPPIELTQNTNFFLPPPANMNNQRVTGNIFPLTFSRYDINIITNTLLG